MSDDLRFVLIVTEGPHDVAIIGKIYKFLGYSELERMQDIPTELQVFIPQKYPSGEDGYLNRAVPRPSYFRKENKYIVVENAGGISKIAEKLSKDISILRESVRQMLYGVAIVADMDNLEYSARQKEMIDQLQAEMDEEEIEIINLGEAKIKGEHEYPLLMFFFPDNKNEGTLEKILLKGASVSYPELLHGAQIYIDDAKKLYSFRNYDDLKATVGVIANVLKPGRANQVSISENEWLTANSIMNLKEHKHFTDFLMSIEKLME